jgi:O-succinylbenzoate synthase
MGVALAAALPELDYDCGLATSSLFTTDVAAARLVARGGVLPVGRVTPDPSLLDELGASPDRVEWWRARVARCYALLGR